MAKLGILAISQPSYLYYNGDGFLANLGPERARKLIPLRSELDLGIPIVLSTDSPRGFLQTPGQHFRRRVPCPRWKARTWVRMSASASRTPYVATPSNAAHSVFLENEKGSIEVGKAADFTLIERRHPEHPRRKDQRPLRNHDRHRRRNPLRFHHPITYPA